MKSPFRLPFVFLILFSVSSLCQYNQSDEALLESTFNRTFDKKIILSYLHSIDARKIDAALLSIAHAEDTSYLPLLFQIDFQKHFEQLTFTIGQLGQSTQAAVFLWKQFDTTREIAQQKVILETLGKVGTKEDLIKIISLSHANKVYSPCGLCLAFYNFGLRNISSDETASILNHLLVSSDKGKEEALFTLYRLGVKDTLILSNVEKIVRDEIRQTKHSTFILQYALGILRRAKFFPDDEALLIELTTNSDPIIRIETAKAAVFFPFKTNSSFDFLLQLLLDKNGNVARQTALSIRDMNFSDDHRTTILKFIRPLITNKNLSAETRGELFVTFIKLLNTLDVGMIGYFSPFVGNEFIYQACGELTFLPDDLFQFLYTSFASESTSNQLFILSSILKHRKEAGNNQNFVSLITTVLKQKSLPLASTLVDELSNQFKTDNSEKIYKAIASLSKECKNDIDFAGSFESFYQFVLKYKPKEVKRFCSSLTSSKVYVTGKLASGKIGKRFKSHTNKKFFTPVFEEAFKYRSAKIETEKGEFTIDFMPSAAPITVGNFCLLAKQKFFDNFKFHRVVPAFVIQGGDPTNTGWSGSKNGIMSEFSPYQFQTGAVGMASSGKDTETSQWFVMQGFHPHLNGRYTLFAIVSKGMETVMQLEQNDKILSVAVIP